MPTSTAVTDLIAKHWCELLETSAVGEDDDFFDSGGNSMLALALVERVQADLGIEFPVEVMFMEGTFGAIVEACAERQET